MKPKVTVKSDDRVWRALRRRLKELGREGAHVKVGVLASTEHVGDGDISLVELAAVHEFGSPSIGVPERSFIRAGLKDQRDSLIKTLNALAKGIVTDTMTVDVGLGKLGLWGQNAVKRYISTGKVTPPLALATIKRKGSSKPLVDTGQLLNSISWEVVA